MKRKKRYSMLIIIITLLVTGSCGTDKAERDKILSRTDLLAEKMLKAIDENSYCDFSSDFSDSLKNEFGENRLHDLHAFMKKSQGDYISKSFFSIIRGKDMVTVQYIAVYKIKTPAYTLSLTFNSSDGSGPITAFNFLPFNVSR
jgi:hypothetical protein